jgi:hypothetical protein
LSCSPPRRRAFFIESDANVWHQFNRNAEGKVSELVMEVDTSKTVLKRMGLPKVAVNDFRWLLGTWKHETATSTTVESWRKASDKTLEGESWRVNKATPQRVFGEAILLAEMGGEIFYVPKTSDNPLPVAFKLNSSNAKELVFENPKHDFPQKITYKLNADGTVTALVEGTMNGQARKLEFHYTKTAQ